MEKEARGERVREADDKENMKEEPREKERERRRREDKGEGGEHRKKENMRKK